MQKFMCFENNSSIHIFNKNHSEFMTLPKFISIYFSSIELPNKNLFNSPNNFNHVKWLVFYQQQQGHNKVTKLSTTKTKTTTTCLHRTTARLIRHPFLPTLLHHRSRQATVTMATTTPVILGNHHRQGNFIIQ